MGVPQLVQMSGITISQKAFDVNVANISYVFDQPVHGPAKGHHDRHPSSVRSVHDSRSFEFHIALFSVNSGASRINMFDVSSNAWTGSTPLYTSSGALPSPTNGTSSNGSSTSLGAIIGSAVGCVVLIALVLFFIIHRRRGGYKKANVSEAVLQTIEYYDHEMPKLAENYVVQQPEPHQLQQQQVVYTLPQNAYVMSSQSSYCNTHTDPNLVYAANNIQLPLTNLPVYQVQPVVGANPDSYLKPYMYAPPVVSTYSSPTIFQAQATQGYGQTTEGSPMTSYENVPNVRGSPQATIVNTNISSDPSQSVPRNPQMSN
ncbi:hypothetical protein BG015_011577 [Linnemannia schmuckeri]|uniref:Uncharacterized protein n=1 Tax=Linnemannia schmuckeri TaxID=64567 RepID=A0A9P5RSV5_9FUNG|nr:hypothetical protein BG015_011577 [Linnemannia schmuckeri]